MFLTSFNFLRQLGSAALVASDDSPATEDTPAVLPLADPAPTTLDSINPAEAVECASATNILFSISRGVTVQPYFYVDGEDRWFASAQTFVVPDGGQIIEVKVLSRLCFLRVVTVPGADTSPVRICSALVRRFGR